MTKAKQDIDRRPFNILGDMAQAALDQLPVDLEDNKHMVPVADVRARFTEIRDEAYGYDARLKAPLDNTGRKRAGLDPRKRKPAKPKAKAPFSGKKGPKGKGGA